MGFDQRRCVALAEPARTQDIDLRRDLDAEALCGQRS